MDDKWRIISCPSCGGHGLTWNPESWFGAVECNDCGQGGIIYIRPKGHTFSWPGGPATGIYSVEAYNKGQPVMPYDWHAWTNSEKEVEEFIIDRNGSFDETLNTVQCACGFSGTIKEHEVHSEEAKQEFIKSHS